MVIREPVKGRGKTQNDLMWAGALADIAAQAWKNGRQYPAEMWHHAMKLVNLPDEFDARTCKEGYRKWDFDPLGNWIMVGRC